MKQQILSIFTRTPLHVGAGSSVGVVDLPVIRERHTSYPVIPGSSLKGVLADLWKEEGVNRVTEKDESGKTKKIYRKEGSEAEMLFGNDNDPKKASAGKLLVGESRVLAFPVRSAKAGFAWCTCPLALGRYLRDAGKTCDMPQLEGMQCVASEQLKLQGKLILEEYVLDCQNDTNGVLKKLAGELACLSDDALWKDEIPKHFVILSDEMFQYFVENTCEIAQHVKINDETGTADGGALFNQENVPAETMFYTTLHETGEDALAKVAAKLAKNDNLLQIGADATTGLGWCSVTLLNGQK